MPAASIYVPLDPNERVALLRMAEADCRHPRDLLRYLLRQEAARRSMLPADQPTNTKEAPHAAKA